MYYSIWLHIFLIHTLLCSAYVATLNLLSYSDYKDIVWFLVPAMAAYGSVAIKTGQTKQLTINAVMLILLATKIPPLTQTWFDLNRQTLSTYSTILAIFVYTALITLIINAVIILLMKKHYFKRHPHLLFDPDGPPSH